MADNPLPGRRKSTHRVSRLHPGVITPQTHQSAAKTAVMPGGRSRYKPKLILLTEAGLRRITAELTYLRTVCRLQVAERLREGLQLGNWDEAPEYVEALKEQALLEERIGYLERKMGMSALLLRDDVSASHVSVGAKVRMRDVWRGEEIECTLIGSLQARPLELVISDESPLGDALLGHQVGDRVEVSAPAGIFEYEILEVRPSELVTYED